LTDIDDIDMCCYTPSDAAPGERRFKLFLLRSDVTLSRLLPQLQLMGVEVLDQRPYELRREDGTHCWIYDFGLSVGSGVLDGLDETQEQRLWERFQDAFAAAWRGACEVDGFNALVLRAGLSWQQAMILRSYARYLRQIGTPYSQQYIADTLVTHSGVSHALVELFESRFDVTVEAADRQERATAHADSLTSMIDEVASRDGDRILRSLRDAVDATVRTNHWMTDSAGNPRPYLALKLDPQRIPELPEPRPHSEMFVCSPRVEGVHLRFGALSRGGLRWSDRRE